MYIYRTVTIHIPKDDIATSSIVRGVLGNIFFFAFPSTPLIKKIQNLTTYNETPNNLQVDHLATAKKVDVFENKLFVKKRTRHF